MQKKKEIVVEGVVVKGLGFAEKIGFPTINVHPRHVPAALKSGIYGVVVYSTRGVFPGVAHYGKRLFHNAPVSFEVHCFDLDESLSRRHVRVVVKERIRDVKNFATLAELTAAIRSDIAIAKKLL